MKPESVPPTRAPEHAQAQRGQPAKPSDAPADLFATLLFAADQGLAVTSSPAPDTEAAVDTRHPTALQPEEPEEPIEPDPVLAALITPMMETPAKPNAAPADTVQPPTLPPDRDPPSIGQWVSTVAKARAKTPPPQLLTEMVQAHLEAAGQTTPTEHGAWHMNAAGQPGGLLSEALGSPEELELSALGSSGAFERSGEQREPGQGHRGDPGRVILETSGSVRQNQETAPGRGFSAVLGETLGDAMHEAFEHLGAQVSLWAAGNAKKASLRLETGLREALDVDVSLQGDKAHLAFRTDDAQVRDVLRTQAQDVLANMLARSGIALEGMSVGSQDRGGGSQPSPERGPGARPAQPETEAQTTPPPVLLGRIAGAGLSVYA